MPRVGNAMEAGQGSETGHVAPGMEVDHNVHVGPDTGSYEIGDSVRDPGERLGTTGSVDEGSVEVDAVGARTLPPARPEGRRTQDGNQHDPPGHRRSVDVPEEVLESYRALVLVTVGGPERNQPLAFPRSGPDPDGEGYQPLTPDGVVRKGYPVVTAPRRLEIQAARVNHLPSHAPSRAPESKRLVIAPGRHIPGLAP